MGWACETKGLKARICCLGFWLSHESYEFDCACALVACQHEFCQYVVLDFGFDDMVEFFTFVVWGDHRSAFRTGEGSVSVYLCEVDCVCYVPSYCGFFHHFLLTPFSFGLMSVA